MQPMRNALLFAALVATACGPAADSTVTAGPQDEFWAGLQDLCGRAYAGRMVEGSPGDTIFEGRDLIMHVRQCSDDEIRIPFHVGDDHSRTWILTRLEEGGLRLKHDHRHRDGMESDTTQYGGDTRDEGTAQRQEFPADEFTASLIPPAATNIWTMEVVPGRTFAYALRREGTDRRVRIEFDLTQEVPTPATPWGY
jgi:hypothetical protein